MPSENFNREREPLNLKKGDVFVCVNWIYAVLMGEELNPGDEVEFDRVENGRLVFVLVRNGREVCLDELCVKRSLKKVN